MTGAMPNEKQNHDLPNGQPHFLVSLVVFSIGTGKQKCEQSPLLLFMSPGTIQGWLSEKAKSSNSCYFKFLKDIYSISKIL